MTHDLHISDFKLWNYLIYFDKYEKIRNENQPDLPNPGLRDKLVEIHLLECSECLSRLKNIQYVKHNPDTAIYEAFPVLRTVKVKSIIQGVKDSGKLKTEHLNTIIKNVENFINNASEKIYSALFPEELSYFSSKEINNVEIISNVDIKDNIIKFQNGILHFKFKTITKFENAILIAANDFFPGRVFPSTKNNPETIVVFKIYDNKIESAEEDESNKKTKSKIIEKSYFAYFY